MKKILAIVTAIALLCTLLISTPVAANAKPKPTVIDVYPGDVITFKINLANEGDVVFVHAGVYHQRISISNKSGITVKGEPGTILDGTAPADTYLDVSVNPPVVRPIPQIIGIWLLNSNGVTVKGFEIRNFQCGVCLARSNDNSVLNNAIDSIGLYTNPLPDGGIIMDNIPGISGKDASGNVFHGDTPSNGNTIRNNVVNSATMGISIWGNDNQILQNEVSSRFDGITIRYDMLNNQNSTNNLIQQNKLKSSDYSAIYLGNVSANSVINNEIADTHTGIVLNGANNNYISKNKVAVSAFGIEVGNSGPNNLANGNTIEKNTVNSSGMGIIITGSSNQLLKNEVLSVYDGIYVCFDTNYNLDSENNLIGKNKVTCTHDNNSAINLVCVHNNTVSQNEVSNSWYGISMYGILNTGTAIFHSVGNNDISQNTVTKSRWFGIAAWDQANSNTIEKNEVSGSITYDLFDISAPSLLNVWTNNSYVTKNWP